MIILIDGKEAHIKPGSTFDVVSENRLFSGREQYTLSIAFPLKGCYDNIEIFGHYNRLDWTANPRKFDCEIRSGAVVLHGVISIVKASDVEVECQFAAGKSQEVVENPFEEVYINSLDLGSPTFISPSSISPKDCWKSIDVGGEEVALPWVNTEYADVPNNWVKYNDTSKSFEWDDIQSISWQPYLIVIAKRICKAIGYSFDFESWEKSYLRHLVICNCLPASWGMHMFNRAMPAWSVSEFFEKLELFLCAEFDFNHKEKSVSMKFSAELVKDTDPVFIEEVADEFSSEFSTEDDTQCNYFGSKRVFYKDAGHQLSKYFSCDWYVAKASMIKKYPNIATMIAKNKPRYRYSSSGKIVSCRYGEPLYEVGEGDQRYTTVDALLYCEAEDTYFVFRSIKAEELTKIGDVSTYFQKYVLQPVNVFGANIPESDAIEEQEIEFVPVCVDDTSIEGEDRGRMMFLAPGQTDGMTSDNLDDDGNIRPGNMGNMSADLDTSHSGDIVQPSAARAIESGEKSKSTACYDSIFVGFFDGALPQPGMPPYPITDYVGITEDWQQLGFNFGMRRFSGDLSYSQNLPKVAPEQKYSFSWKSDIIPDARAIFFIRGRRYVCEKITASFSDEGMSRIIKGEFYPLID